MSRLFWLIAFGIATFSLSQVFHVMRLFEHGAQVSLFGQLLFWAVLLVVSFMLLGYSSYTKAKQEGKVTRQIRLFDKINAIGGQ